MGAALLEGLIAGYGIAIPVGAIALLIVGVSMRCGFLCGFSAGAGAATADLFYAVVAAAAGSVVAAALSPWERWIRVASALVLTAMAIWGLLAVRRGGDSSSELTATPTRSDLAGTYARFVGLTVINPMTVVYFAALVMGAGITGGGWVAALAFVLGAFVASLSWQTLLAAVGTLGRRGLTPQARNYTLVLGNLVILVLAGRILVG